MNDLKDFTKNIIYDETVKGFICTDKFYKELKDYIINLQQYYNENVNKYEELLEKYSNLQQKVEQYENPDDLTLFYMWLDEKAKDKMKKLQQENIKLISENEAIKNIKYTVDEVIYKSRIDEAIQYLKCHSIIYKENGEEFCELDEYFNPYWCIDILNGNDEGLETLKTFVDYKERVRKAIEYIEKEYQDNIIITDYADNPITPQELYGELLDILKGDSK